MTTYRLLSPLMARRMARTLRRNGYPARARGHCVTVETDDDRTRTIAGRYAAVRAAVDGAR
jgi:hypothetical protein